MAENVCDDSPETDPAEVNHIQRFMDRVRFLIVTDEDLNVAECVGALMMLAHELSSHGVFPDWHQADGEEE